jgi:heme/copper-type cytochrome/quinol oxidase subunit 3
VSEIGAEGVPRSSTARSAAAAARVDRGRRAQPSGWWGMVLFLCSEVTLFGTLIGSYFYLDFIARRWPPAGIKSPEALAPAVATAVLLGTVPLMWLALRAALTGRQGRTIAWIGLAMAVQAAYLAAQVLLFRHDLRQFTPQGSAYGSIYFTLLAAHHAHVLFGLLLDGAVLWKVARHGLTNYWLIGVRGLVLYWYVVGGLAVVVLFTVLSPAL